MKINSVSRNWRSGIASLLLAMSLLFPAKATGYVLSGYTLSNTNVSISYPPDGTASDTGAKTNMFAAMSCGCSSADWQRQVAIALQAWAAVTPLNFYLVSDSGVAWNTSGAQGVNRNSGYPFSGTNSGYAGYTYYPSSSTAGSDLFLNTTYNWTTEPNYNTITSTSKICGCAGQQVPLLGILEHELGHGIGLGHSTLTSAIMYPTYWGQGPQLDPDDIAGAQAMYGARKPDSYEPNDSIGAATPLSGTSATVTATGDITTTADVDCYKVTMPGSGTFTASVKVSQTSLLPPKLMIYDSANNLVGSATGDYSQDISVSIANASQGATYYACVMGDTTNPVPSIGTYNLQMSLPGGSSTPPPSSSSMGVSPASIDFGSVAVRTRKSASVKLTNQGTSAITISKVSVSNSLFKTSGISVPMTLAGGQSASFTVTFSPKAVGPASATVTLTSNATNSSASVTLSGTGTK